jgi:hypothetical protein
MPYRLRWKTECAQADQHLLLRRMLLMVRMMVAATAVLLGVGAALLIVRAGSPARAETPPSTGQAPAVVLKPGDRITVEGAHMGCQVARRGGRPTLDCRRAGSLRGTYGVLLTERRVTVARFRSSSTAKEIFVARHGGSYRVCGRSTTARTAAQGDCR